MHEVPGFFAFTSANSAFAALEPEVSICASCKPVLLCSDGCGAAAVTVSCPKHAPHAQRCEPCSTHRQQGRAQSRSRCGRGASPVAEQMWQRGEPSRGADVAEGLAQSRRRCGRGLSPVSPGADVAEA